MSVPISFILRVYKFCQSQFSLHYCFFIGFGLFVVAPCAPRWLSYVNLRLSFIHVKSNIFLLVLFIRQICDYYLLVMVLLYATYQFLVDIYYGYIFRLIYTIFFFIYAYLWNDIYLFYRILYKYIKYCYNLSGQSLWCSNQEYIYYYDNVSLIVGG